jgi:hypothetical protein
MTKRHDITGDDAIRLLCNAIQKIHHFDKHGEGHSPLCRDAGELMLQAALEYLAWGDTDGARSLMDDYDNWLKTGEAPWPYDSSKPPPSSVSRRQEPEDGPADDRDDGVPF